MSRSTLFGVALVVGWWAGPCPAQAPAEPPTDPADPAALPIPIGPVAERQWFVTFERSAAGPGVGLSVREVDGTWSGWPVAGSPGGPEVRTPFFQTDYSRTGLLARLRPVGFGVHHELFIHNSWSAEFEAEPSGPAARLQWFPIEGVVLGLGFDARRGVVARCRLGF